MKWKWREWAMTGIREKKKRMKNEENIYIKKTNVTMQDKKIIRETGIGWEEGTNEKLYQYY